MENTSTPYKGELHRYAKTGYRYQQAEFGVIVVTFVVGQLAVMNPGLVPI